MGLLTSLLLLGEFGRSILIRILNLHWGSCLLANPKNFSTTARNINISFLKISTSLDPLIWSSSLVLNLKINLKLIINSIFETWSLFSALSCSYSQCHVSEYGETSASTKLQNLKLPKAGTKSAQSWHIWVLYFKLIMIPGRIL